MNYIRAELIKLLKAPFLWILSSAYIVMNLLLFYQYTLNDGANVIEPLLKNPVNLYSFFLIMFAVFFNIFFSVLLGSNVVGKDFSDNTIQCVIQSSGRYKSFAAKIAVIFLVSFVFLCVVVIMGILLGFVHSTDLSQFSVTELLERFAISFLSTVLLSFFSMTIAVILKSASKSNIFCILLILSQNFLPYDISRFLAYLNPYYYLSVFSDSAFSNLKGLSFVKFGSANSMSAVENIGMLIVFAAVCMLVQFIIYKKREYL